MCIIGAESTGTTTLSKQLAEHYKTVWVPEYGRIYSEGKLYAEGGGEWNSEEFTTIAKAQEALEDSLAESSNGLVICDTDPLATRVWHERYMRKSSPAVEAIAARRNYTLYILTGDEIPFVQDGTRDGEHVRHGMHKRFRERLTESGKHFIEVSGTPEVRLQAAIRAIDELSKS